jgi:dTDP-4-amino-4,6-dideoxygalactose transaminase
MALQLFRPLYEVEECLREIRKVLETGWTGCGPKCVEFEKAWQDYTGAQYAHFVSSATAALHIAVRLLDLPKGSKIVSTPITFVSTNAAIVYEGHDPVFADVASDMSLRFESVEKAVKTTGAEAVIWVHYGGSVSQDFYTLMDAVNSGKLDAQVIEDCAHASGACYKDGTRVGSRTDTISIFSFHSVKNLPIMDGGMICVPNPQMLERAKALSWLGIDKGTFARTVDGANEVYKWAYNVPELGWKYNGNDIAASIGLVQLKYLDRDNAYRTQIYEWYKDLLGDKIMTHQRGSSHHLLVAWVKDRDGVIAKLKANGIAPGVHYLPNYLFPVFEKYDHSLCVNAERAFGEIISLPNHLEMTKKDVATICGIIQNGS